MAHTTARRALRVPDLTDNPDVVRDITNLASDVDTAMASLQTGAALPSSGEKDGDVFWLTSDTTMSPNGTPYKWDNTNGQWRIWAPPVDPVAAQGGSRTLGTGAQQAAAGNDTRLSDARTPLAHAASHRPGGSDALAALAASALQVKDVGISGQLRAGRVFTLADFTALLGLSAPVGLYNLTDLTDASGNNRSLTNKGAVTFGGTGIAGQANVAIFHGGTTDALYRLDSGAGDPFRVTTGSWGCWFKTGKRGTGQGLVSKDQGNVAGLAGYRLEISSLNQLNINVSFDGSTYAISQAGSTDVCDDRWHFALATFDGTEARVYLDGALEILIEATGLMSVNAAPVNIGSIRADAATNAVVPLFGRIDEAFITADIVNDNEQRLLYASKLAHGQSVAPNAVNVNVKRRRKGASLVVADFPASPRRLYNFTAASLGDAGLDGAGLTNNAAAASAAGADGAQAGAFQLASGSAQYLSAADTGLPTGGAVCLGAWFKTLITAGGPIIVGYGGAANQQRTLYVANGNIAMYDSTSLAGPFAADGQWHFAVAVWDPAGTTVTDGLRRRLYLDGKLVASDTTAAPAATLGGANAFRIGRDVAAATNYMTGTIDSVFATDYVLTLEQINSLWLKGSQQLAASPKNEGDHIEGVDATNLYIIGDTLEGQHMIDIRVAA